MLVLSRRQNESIVTSNGVRITVCQIRGNVVRLGFEAPESVAIHRQEIFDLIVGNENCQANKEPK